MVRPFTDAVERKTRWQARLIKIHKKILAARVLRARVLLDHGNSLAKRHLCTKQQLGNTQPAGRTFL
jgi:hypothetical protein